MPEAVGPCLEMVLTRAIPDTIGLLRCALFLGSSVVPFSPFCYGVSLLKPNSSKKGTLIIKGLLGNLGFGLPKGSKR